MKCHEIHLKSSMKSAHIVLNIGWREWLGFFRSKAVLQNHSSSRSLIKMVTAISQRPSFDM